MSGGAMGIHFSFITGVSVGIEFADQEELDIPHAKWGVSLDLFIIRIVFISYDMKMKF
jgi:hypothetical protein